jgi:Prokaryotic homologs of the JAB domain
MLHGLLSSAGYFLSELRRTWLDYRPARPPESSAATVPPLVALERLRLTDGVGRTLFEEYASHRAAARGDEETGWVLLGLRETREAVALATLPAGGLRDASVSHVQFNSLAQAVGSRIIRQLDRRLTILGVVHTHPGSLRHPSDGDLRGDRVWVQQLRGREGVFGIGTSDASCLQASLFAVQPRPNVQCLGDLRFSWYALAQGESMYRPLPVELTLGPDLARGLHSAWPTLERHAERLERLCKQQAHSRIDVFPDPSTPGLLITIPLAGEGNSVRVLLRGEEVLYLVERQGALFEADHIDALIDRGVYRLLAELAQDD